MATAAWCSRLTFVARARAAQVSDRLRGSAQLSDAGQGMLLSGLKTHRELTARSPIQRPRLRGMKIGHSLILQTMKDSPFGPWRTHRP
ncbi:hypothetical protein NDU88_002110 [Pleurodeles waltl]|uniref:Uncharacterized protein n=1 Tax=Pleurodeles waltl TaxID=8319 RepID=A0AAV7MLN4_PLEWA|nr:hypothetical protein NDU88_002110 [Pleurodeles waltl]